MHYTGGERLESGKTMISVTLLRRPISIIIIIIILVNIRILFGQPTTVPDSVYIYS